MKKIKIKRHNGRETVLLECIKFQCEECIKNNLAYYIEKINGLSASMYMLDIIDSPYVVVNFDDVRKLNDMLNHMLNHGYEHIKESEEI